MEDLSQAHALCEALGGTYDEGAVRHCRTLESTLERLRLERFGHFAGIVNAIENHVEEGDGAATVVRHLGEALLALAAVHRIDGPYDQADHADPWRTTRLRRGPRPTVNTYLQANRAGYLPGIRPTTGHQ